MKKRKVLPLWAGVAVMGLISSCSLGARGGNFLGPPSGPLPKLDQRASDGVLLPGPAEKFLEGEIALIEKDPTRAAAAYQAAIALDPGNLFLMTSLATAHREGGNLKAAESLLKKVLLKQPDFEPALTLLGAIYRDLGNTPLAEHYYKMATTAAPDSPDAYLGLVSLYEGVGNQRAALEVAELLIEKIPDLPDGYALSAQLAFSLGLVEKSQLRTLQYIALIPLGERRDAWKFLLKQAWSMLDRGREDYALVLLDTYREIYPDNPSAIAATVTALRKVGRLDEARKVALSVKVKEGEEEAAFMLKAQLLYETGDFEKAFELVQKMHRKEGGETITQSAKVIMAVGNAWMLEVEEAKRWLATFGKEEILWRKEALQGIWRALISSGLENEAWSILLADPASRLALEDFEMMHDAAVALSRNPHGKLFTELSLRLAGDSAAELFLRWSGFMAGMEADREWLKANIERLAQKGKSPSLRRAAMIIEGILIGEKVIESDNRRIIDIVVKIKELDPDCWTIPLLRARFFHLTSNKEQAKAEYEKAESQNGGDFITKLWYAELLGALGKEAEARKKLSAALALGPPLYFTKRTLGVFLMPSNSHPMECGA